MNKDILQPMIKIEEKELGSFVEEIKHVLKKEDYLDLEKDYHQSMEQAVKDGYSKVFIKKYFEDFVFKKITTTNK